MASSSPPSFSSGAHLEPRTEDLSIENRNGTPGGSRMDTGGTPPESRNYTTSTTTTTTTTTTIPTFFILHSLTETPLGTMSPFFVQKSLDGLVGTVKKVTKMRSGDLLVETPNATISRNMLRVKAFGDVPISVTPHATLNYSRGVVVSRDLIGVSEKELLEGMSSQGVVAVKRIMLRKDGRPVPSRVLIITFDRPKLPDSIKAGYIHCSVQPYIPNPLRCFACQRFGHAKTSCRGTPICARCAGIDHDFEACEADPVCANCLGKHPAYSRSCQKWQTEKTIQRYRVEKGVSYPEARRAVLPPSDKPSYASVVQVQRMTVETQTSVSAPPDTSFSAASVGLTQRMPCCSCGHVCTSKPQTSTESTTSNKPPVPISNQPDTNDKPSTSDTSSFQPQTSVITTLAKPSTSDTNMSITNQHADSNVKPSTINRKKTIISRKPTSAATAYRLKQALKATDFLKSPPEPGQPSRAEVRRQVSKPAPIFSSKIYTDIVKSNSSVNSSLSDGGSRGDPLLGSHGEPLLGSSRDPDPEGRDRSPIREGRKKRSKMKITPP